MSGQKQPHDWLTVCQSVLAVDQPSDNPNSMSNLDPNLRFDLLLTVDLFNEILINQPLVPIYTLIITKKVGIVRFSLFMSKGNPTHVFAQLPTHGTHMTHTASAGFVLCSAMHTLFNINSRCKQVRQFSDDHTIDQHSPLATSAGSLALPSDDILATSLASSCIITELLPLLLSHLLTSTHL